MAGGKSTKRVNLRTKAARKERQQHQQPSASNAPAGEGGVAGSTSSTVSAPTPTPPVAAPGAQADGDRQTALQIRDALRQRHGRAARAPLTKLKGASAPASASGSAGAAFGKRNSAKKASAKASGSSLSSQHPAALRRAAVLERRRLVLPHMSAAEERMAVAQAELQLFEKVQAVPAYAADPFAAVMQHLSATMDALQPQTPDVGRAARAAAEGGSMGR